MIDDALLDYIDGKWCLDGVPFDGVSKSNRGNYRWYKDGRYHREDGPAIEYADVTDDWYLHGERIFTWKEYHEKSTLSPQEQMIVKLKYGEHLK